MAHPFLVNMFEVILYGSRFSIEQQWMVIQGLIKYTDYMKILESLKYHGKNGDIVSGVSTAMQCCEE